MNNNLWKKSIRSYDDRRDIVVPGDAEATVRYAVEHFLALANKSIDSRGIFAVALSGGSTPKAIYETLSRQPYRDRIAWDKVFLFWSDERCVPPDHPQSNYRMAMNAGISSLPIPQEHIFRMPAEHDAEEGAIVYEMLIRERTPSGAFDLVMLGMGEDGHTASLFPKTHGLHTEDRLVIANYIQQKNEWRMSLTFECINAARHPAIYLIGNNKAEMFKYVLTAPYQPDELPIQRVGTPEHKALWIVDDAAADKMIPSSQN